MTDIQLSVIIPTYNRVDYLREAIESVLAQTFTDFELIVVDDGSTDGTRELAASYKGRVRYISQQNCGPSAARNNGIKNAVGRYIAFLDSDDIWLPEMLAKQVAMLSKDPAAGLTATGYGLINTGHQLTGTIIMKEDELADARNGDLYKNFFATSSVMVKKLCFQTVGLFNENLHFAEDWDMWIRILQRYSFVYLPEALMHYRVHPDKISATSLQENMNQWQTVIDLHTSSGKTLNDLILKRKRTSWLYLNQSWSQSGYDSALEKSFMLKSILAWPLWFPGRYSFFLKRMIKAV